MPEAVLAPGARIECRSAEWLVRSLGRSSDGQQVVDVVGVSPFLREKDPRFLVEVEQAAGSRQLQGAATGSNRAGRRSLAAIPQQPAVH